MCGCGERYEIIVHIHCILSKFDEYHSIIINKISSQNLQYLNHGPLSWSHFHQHGALSLHTKLEDRSIAKLDSLFPTVRPLDDSKDA